MSTRTTKDQSNQPSRRRLVPHGNPLPPASDKSERVSSSGLKKRCRDAFVDVAKDEDEEEEHDEQVQEPAERYPRLRGTTSSSPTFGQPKLEEEDEVKEIPLRRLAAGRTQPRLTTARAAASSSSSSLTMRHQHSEESSEEEADSSEEDDDDSGRVDSASPTHGDDEVEEAELPLPSPHSPRHEKVNRLWPFGPPRTLVNTLKSWEDSALLYKLDDVFNDYVLHSDEETRKELMHALFDEHFVRDVYMLHLINRTTPPTSDPGSLAKVWSLTDDTAGKNPTYRGRFWKTKMIDEFVVYLRTTVDQRFHEELEPLLTLVRERLGRDDRLLKRMVPHFEVESGVSTSRELITRMVELPFCPVTKSDTKNIMYTLSRSPWVQKFPGSVIDFGGEASILFWGLVTEADVSRLPLLNVEGDNVPGTSSLMWGLRNAQNLLEWRSLFFYQMLSTIAGPGPLAHWDLRGTRSRCCDALDKLRLVSGMRMYEILDDVFMGELGPEVLALVARIDATYFRGEKSHTSAMTSIVNVINHAYHCVHFNRAEFIYGNPVLLDQVLSVWGMLTPEARLEKVTTPLYTRCGFITTPDTDEEEER